MSDLQPWEIVRRSLPQMGVHHPDFLEDVQGERFQQLIADTYSYFAETADKHGPQAIQSLGRQLEKQRQFFKDLHDDISSEETRLKEELGTNTMVLDHIEREEPDGRKEQEERLRAKRNTLLDMIAGAAQRRLRAANAVDFLDFRRDTLRLFQARRIAFGTTEALTEDELENFATESARADSGADAAEILKHVADNPVRTAKRRLAIEQAMPQFPEQMSQETKHEMAENWNVSIKTIERDASEIRKDRAIPQKHE